MKLEAGKFYKTRNGLKFGPAEEVYPSSSSGWVVPSNNGHPATYDSYGNRISPCCSNEEDLVSEWRDGPVRTVTRREIIPGQYGRIYVGGLDRVERKNAIIQLNEHDPFQPMNALSAEELREASHIFNQLAEALEDKS